MTSTVVDHPQYGKLISIQDLARGFNCKSPQRLYLNPSPARVKVRGLSYVRLADVIAAVREDWFTGGGTLPNQEFRAFVRQFRKPPAPSRWVLETDTAEWTITGRDSLVTIKPARGHYAGNYVVQPRVYGDASWHGDWISRESQAWPRPYYDLENAKREAEEWLRMHDQVVE